jgi:Protein of unknown function (DUF3108)
VISIPVITSRRIAFAAFISLVPLPGLALSLQANSPQQDNSLTTSAPAAISSPVDTVVLLPETGNQAKRPLLPKHARLTFDVNKGTSQFRVGEVVHTLEIDNGHYILHAVTKTVGLAKLFKSYELIQDSSGSYNKNGLLPDRFFEERIEKPDVRRNSAKFDHAARRARFSHGGEAVLPADTQDILSIMYQFPPLTEAGKATVFVSNGKKIERYQFTIVTDEAIDTALGKLLTVHLSKLHSPDEEGLEIWLAREYHLFPVKIRYIEKNGEVSGEAVITDIRVSEEQGARSDAVN